MACSAAVLAAALASPWAFAQTYPNKPIKFVVPFSAVSATDAVGRIVAQAMGDALGQTVTVENKAGANGILGAEAVKAAPGRWLHLFSHHQHHASGQSELV
jgi:tripartite-type tricarboxylate transporter receptor subunit TctC